MRAYTTVACLVCALLDPTGSAAQDRVRVNLDAAEQSTATDFTATATFVEFIEQGQITTEHRVRTGPVFGGGASVRVWKQLALGAAFSYYSKATAANVEAQLPHPFLFDHPRTASGTPSGLKRRETATHLFVGWIIPATDRMELIVSGGPTIFQVNQDLVTGVTYTHAYPYDEAQFTGATSQRAKNRALGVHAGADVIWKFSQRVGVGGILRYARGTFDTAIGSDSVSFDVGGLHAGGGLRLIF
jgi:hypothetical protein